MASNSTDSPKPIVFFVGGVARPQGSKRAFVRPGTTQATLVEAAGVPLKEWRKLIRYAATLEGRQILGPVFVSLAFRFPRAKGHFGTGKNADVLKASAPSDHTKKPDLDKLTRAVLDAITHVVIQDDSAVVQLSATKHYSTQHNQPGCLIRVEAVTA